MSVCSGISTSRALAEELEGGGGGGGGEGRYEVERGRGRGGRGGGGGGGSGGGGRGGGRDRMYEHGLFVGEPAIPCVDVDVGGEEEAEELVTASVEFTKVTLLLQ